MSTSRRSSDIYWNDLIDRFRDLFAVRYEYDNQLDQLRARALLRLAYGIGIISVLTTTFLAIAGALEAIEFQNSLFLSFVASFTLLASAPIISYLLDRGYLRALSIGFLFIIQVLTVIQFYIFGFQPEPIIILAIPPVLAGLLLTPRWAYIVSGTSLVSLAITASNGINDGQIPTIGGFELTAADVIPSVLVIGVMYFVIAFLSGQVSSILMQYARASQRINTQIAAVAAVSEAAARSGNLAQLLDEVVNRIREAYGFYHAQVFLTDPEGRLARLQASTGRAGEALLARAHALPVGSQSVVGQCTAKAQPVVVNDTLTSATHRPNPLLPDTRAELALPLIVGQEVIGAIDVQSVEPNVFLPDDIRSLQVMAGQLAVSIDKTRILDELQASAVENTQLLEETQRNLRQIEDLNRRLTREGWTDYLQSRRVSGTVGYTLYPDRLEVDREWSASMLQAVNTENSVVLRQDKDAQIAAIPLRVRGEVIGVLEVERDGERPWTDVDLDMVETLVDRLALAVENARLYEQTTEAVQREQLVNEISQKVQGAETIDEVLQAALTELTQVLGAKTSLVQINPEARLEDPDDDNENHAKPSNNES